MTDRTHHEAWATTCRPQPTPTTNWILALTRWAALDQPIAARTTILYGNYLADLELTRLTQPTTPLPSEEP